METTSQIAQPLESPPQPTWQVQFHEPPKPGQTVVYINASAIKSESNCDLRFLRRVLLGYSKENRLSNYKAGYGTAFHKGIEVWYDKEPDFRDHTLMHSLINTKVLPTFQPYEPYIEAGPYGWRNATHLTQAFTKYCESFPGPTDPLKALKITTSTNGNLKTTSLLEQKFCIPYFETPELIVYLVGTIDMPGEYCGELCICDHKTTSRKPSDFFELFKLNTQAQFYVSNFRRLTGMKSYVPFLVNGIFLNKNKVEDEKKGIFNGVTFQRKLISYEDEAMKRFENWLNNKLLSICNYLQAYVKFSDEPSYNPTACDGKWNVCQYYNVCSGGEQFKDITLQSCFKQEKYNPLAHIEEEI